jgi:hypothetical protein
MEEIISRIVQDNIFMTINYVRAFYENGYLPFICELRKDSYYAYGKGSTIERSIVNALKEFDENYTIIIKIKN